MKLFFILSLLVLCLIGVQSLNVARHLFPEGFDKALEKDHLKKVNPTGTCGSSSPTNP